MKVLWVVVDALGHDKVTPALMPWLCGLAEQGGRADGGGVAVMPALTYPNHASFVTGAEPVRHGIVTNHVHRDGAWVGAQQVGPSSPAIFERLAGSGVSTAAFFGDQNLVGVCAAAAAGVHWPPGGAHDPDTPTAGTGYATDAAVLEAVSGAGAAAADLLFVQLDETDSVSHIEGPDSAQARSLARAVDAALAGLAELYRDCWEETVMIVVSDHAQEPVVPGRAIHFDDVMADALGGDPPENPHVGDASGRWRCDGTAAWISAGACRQVGDPAALSGIEGAELLGDGSAVVWGGHGALLGLQWGQQGDHGSPRTARQVAVVGGGHPRARHIGAAISAAAPRATDWAPTVLGLLGAGGAEGVAAAGREGP